MASAHVQYGPWVRALAVYLHQYQFVPMQRTCEMLSELCGCEISEGTLAEWVELAAETLSPTLEQIAQEVLGSPLQHADETGVHLGSKLHWVHVNSTRFLTHLAWEAGMRSTRDHRPLAALPRALHTRSVGKL